MQINFFWKVYEKRCCWVQWTRRAETFLGFNLNIDFFNVFKKLIFLKNDFCTLRKYQCKKIEWYKARSKHVPEWKVNIFSYERKSSQIIIN